MGRLKELRTYVDGELEALAPEKRNSAIVHLYGVSLAATMIAQKRGLDAELLPMAAMLHDLYAYSGGLYISDGCTVGGGGFKGEVSGSM